MINKSSIPRHWDKRNLSDVCDILDGKRKPINSSDRMKRISGKKENELFPYFGATGQVGWIDNYLLDGNYVLLGEDGAPFLDHFKDKAYLVSGKIWVNNHAHILKSKYSNKFLCYYLNSIDYSKFVSGTTRLKLNQASMKQIPVPLPPLSEQNQIVAKIEELFSELDKGKEQLEKVKEQLKTYRQSVLKWAFEGRFTNENVKDGELPEGWKWMKVVEICEVVRGGSPRPAGDSSYYNGPIPFLKVADITKNNNKYLNTYSYSIKPSGLKKTRLISPNTLLLSNSGATLGVPKICMIEATINDGIAAFLYLNERSIHYLYYYWLSKTRELRNINMGAAQPNLNTEIIKNYLVPYCSFHEQEKIVHEIESRLSVCDKMEETIESSLSQIESLRQSILKQAFEGKLV